MRSICYICKRPGLDGLCKSHAEKYMWDSSIQGFRLKKRLTGSRYTQNDYHKNEIRLTKIIENYYGYTNVVTGYHPIWAVSNKDVLLEFDIYIKSLNLAIEYNGQQHYEHTPFFQRTKKIFNQRKRLDRLKLKLAKKNKTKVIIFKYDEPMFDDYVITKVEKEK